MIKYRIKTEEEFINEFGKHWRSVIRGHWNSNIDGMDYLFGSEIPKCSFKELSSDWFSVNYDSLYFRLEIPTNDFFEYFWSLSIDMIKEINVINYNQKKY